MENKTEQGLTGSSSVNMRILPMVSAIAAMVAVAVAAIMGVRDEHGKKEIYRDEASRSAAWHAGWSDATISNGTIYLSGIVVTTDDPASGRQVDLAFDQAFLRMGDTLKAAGASMDDVADITVYMVDVRAHLPALDKARMKVMRPPYAASTVVQVTRLIPDGAIAEIRAVAHRPSPGWNMRVPQ